MNLRMSSEPTASRAAEASRAPAEEKLRYLSVGTPPGGMVARTITTTMPASTTKRATAAIISNIVGRIA